MIQLEKVSAGYGKQEILHGVDLEIPRGKISTVIGANGSGKSTLLRVILGFLPLWGGEIRIDGTSIKEMERAEIARKIAYLPQGKNVPDGPPRALSLSALSQKVPGDGFQDSRGGHEADGY